MVRKTKYIGIRNKSCDIVEIGFDWFDYRNGEDELPKEKAWCRNCATESAKVMYPIYMNARPAYGLMCEKCGSEYPMYQMDFSYRYRGKSYGNGCILPTKGMKSIVQAMDREARAHYVKKKEETVDRMCEEFHQTKEEYLKRKEKWDKEASKRRKEFDANLDRTILESKVERDSSRRRELIQKGVLKYQKGVLVNTETGEVIKL